MRVVSNTSNYKRPRDKYPKPVYRAQEKNAYGAWEDVSPLMEGETMNEWLSGQGYDPIFLSAEGLRFYFPVKKGAGDRPVRTSMPNDFFDVSDAFLAILRGAKFV